jgi:protease I
MTAEPDLSHTTIAFLATDGVEQVELTGPWEALAEAGASLHLVSNTDEVQGFNHLDKADTFPVDRQVSDLNPTAYDALVLPGGVANADALRTDPQAVAVARGFIEGGKIVAVICHGAWTLIEADAVRGRELTSWPSLQTDLRNAGATWVDREVVVDQGKDGAGLLISSRKPDDIDAFVGALTDALASLPTTADVPG